MKTYLATAVVLFSTAMLAAAEPEALPIWPGAAPGETAPLPPEADLTKPTDNSIAGRPLIRLGNVSTPTITVYKPDPVKDTGAAIVVFPGGGYHILAIDLEGTEVAEWLNSIGVTAVVLKYRVPRREGFERYELALKDAQRAVGIVRQRAAEWGIDPRRIGVLGFSAGAHLAAALSNHHATRSYETVDAADAVSCRPDFAVLVYPGGFTIKEENDRVQPLLVPDAAKTPPMFLTMAQDDPVRVENAVLYYLALKQANVPAELHVYPTGGHGYGLRRTDNPVTWWPERVAEWMTASGWLAGK